MARGDHHRTKRCTGIWNLHRAQDPGRPTAIVRNVTLGYQHMNDPSCLEGLVGPYFAALGDIWKSRSYKIAETFVLGLYPAALAPQALADTTRAWLDTNTDVPALRRLIIENLAGVERALTAQARDRT